MKQGFDLNFNNIGIFIFFVTIFLCVNALGIANNYLDFDLWARLIQGAFTYNNLHPLFGDIFSYTDTHVWYDPEWLSSTLFYFVQKNFGICGITLLKCLLFICYIYSLVFVLKKMNPKLTVYNLAYFLFLICICFQFSFISFAVRCQFFTFIFFVFWIYFLEKVRQKDNKYLFVMPFLMLLWQNCHGGCIAGIAVIFIYILGEILNKKPFLKYVYLLIALFLVLFINPWGLDYIKFLFDSIFLDRSVIAEWKTPFESVPVLFNLYFYYILLILIVLFVQAINNMTNYKNLDKTKLLMVCVLLYISFSHVKHIPLALTVFTIFLFKDVVFGFNIIFSKLKFNNLPLKNIFNFILYFIVISYSVLRLSVISCLDTFKKPFLEQYPVKMLEVLRLNKINGKILTFFNYGSFISYKYYPELKIFMDGRQEQVYDRQIYYQLDNFIDQIGDNPNIILDEYEPNIVLLPLGCSATKAMFLNEKYALLLSDSKFSIFVLKKHKKEKLILPDNVFDKYLDDIFKTSINFALKENG